MSLLYVVTANITANITDNNNRRTWPISHGHRFQCFRHGHMASQSSVWETSVAPWRHHLRRCGSCSRDVGLSFWKIWSIPCFESFSLHSLTWNLWQDVRKLYGDDPWQRNCTVKSCSAFSVSWTVWPTWHLRWLTIRKGPTDDDETSEYTPPEAGGFKCDLSCLEVQIDVFALEWASALEICHLSSRFSQEIYLVTKDYQLSG